MRAFLKNLALAGALAGLWCGGAVAQEDYARDVNSIAEDTTREMITALHSRLDAFRKIREPAPQILRLNTPSAEVEGFTTLSPSGGEYGGDDGIVDDAYGSLAVPGCTYGDRYLNRFWGGGIGSWQNQDTGGGFTGYSYDAQGVLLGFDRFQGPALFGIALSYMKGEYENDGMQEHDSEIKHYSANAHFTYNGSRGFFLTLNGGYTYSDSDIHEWDAADTWRENYHSGTWNAGARIGFDFEPDSRTVITPSIGANFFHSKSDAHDAFDTDTPTGALTGTTGFGRMKHHMLEIPLEVSIAHEVDFGKNRLLQLGANGGYAYNLTNKGVRGDVTDGSPLRKFQYVGREPGRGAFKAGASARLKMDQWDIGVKYDYYRRSDFDSHRVMGTVGYSF